MVDMTGYKIYFDGKKFVMDDYRTHVETTAGDSTTHWNAEYKTACAAVENLNSKLKQNIDTLVNGQDFIVRTCKECGEYFLITKDHVDWFTSRKLHVPCRCERCRTSGIKVKMFAKK